MSPAEFNHAMYVQISMKVPIEIMEVITQMPRVENVLYDSMTLDHGSYHSASSNAISRHHMVRTSITG